MERWFASGVGLMSGTKISSAPDAGAYDPTWRIPIAASGVSAPLSTSAAALQGAGGLFLPLIGGNIAGIVNLVDPGGAIQSSRNITWAVPSGSLANLPFALNMTFTGTNLDPPTAGFANPIQFNSTFNAFNGSGLGMRTAQFVSNSGPGTVGIFTGLTSVAQQFSPHPPGTNKWAANTAYSLNFAMTNNLAAYVVTQAGTSASSGGGPSGYGSAIADGTIVWQYLGPLVPTNWVTLTSYPTQGQLVINPNNGGLFRVQTPGISGPAPGPVRYRAPFIAVRLAATGNVASISGLLIIDGVQTNEGDRVLLPLQSSQATNGIYIATAAGAWSRSTDADQWSEIFSKFAPVTAGVVNAGLGYLNTNSDGGTIDTTAMTWVLSTPPSINSIPDGSVIWAQKGVGNSAYFNIGFSASGTSSFNLGGQNANASLGHQWGAIIGSTVTPNATFLSESVGLEVDDRVTGSARKVVGVQIVRAGNQGLFTDIGFIINVNSGFSRYKTGVQLSNIADPNYGYGIIFEPYGGVGLQHMAGALDMKLVAPDGATGPFGGGFYARWGNGMLDQFGAQQMRFSSITPTNSGLTIDVTNVELQSIAIISGGASWQVGGYWKGSDGSWGSVRTVDGSGAILIANVVGKSQVTAPGPSTITLSPFSPDSTLDSLGGDPDPTNSGPTGDVIWPTPATATPTYAAAATANVALGSAAVDVIVGKGAAGTTTQTAGFLEIPFVAGPPTGVPANSTKGIAVVFDTTNHKLWCYDNGASAWKGVVLT